MHQCCSSDFIVDFKQVFCIQGDYLHPLLTHLSPDIMYFYQMKVRTPKLFLTLCRVDTHKSNLWFSGVFTGYKMGTFARNSLKTKHI